MKNKLELIAKLLKEEKVTVEEAAILMETEKEYVSIPYNPQPFYPTYPTSPYIPLGPVYYTTCNSTTLN